MSIHVNRINRYSAFRYPQEGSSEARINCHAEGGYRVYILFVADGTTRPSNSYNASSKTGVGFDYVSNFPAYVDLLRNEDPVWVTINEDRAVYVVYAASEPVGEGEM